MTAKGLLPAFKVFSTLNFLIFTTETVSSSLLATKNLEFDKLVSIPAGDFQTLFS